MNPLAEICDAVYARVVHGLPLRTSASRSFAKAGHRVARYCAECARITNDSEGLLTIIYNIVSKVGGEAGPLESAARSQNGHEAVERSLPDHGDAPVDWGTFSAGRPAQPRTCLAARCDNPVSGEGSWWCAFHRLERQRLQSEQNRLAEDAVKTRISRRDVLEAHLRSVLANPPPSRADVDAEVFRPVREQWIPEEARQGPPDPRFKIESIEVNGDEEDAAHEIAYECGCALCRRRRGNVQGARWRLEVPRTPGWYFVAEPDGELKGCRYFEADILAGYEAGRYRRLQFYPGPSDPPPPPDWGFCS